MDDLFRKTINLFNAPGGVDDDFVGQIVEVGSIKLKILKKIAEGGFAIVYVAKDIQNGDEFALKRLFGSDKDECNNIINEINVNKQVSGHDNIVKFVAASFIDRTKSGGRAEYLLVTELCKGGSLYDYLDQINNPPTVLKVIYQATKAVAHLHSQNINHRDIKIENFLLGCDSLLKLCDMGSATMESHSPDITWSTQQRNSLEEFLQKFTTPMYRAPEQLDTWNNYPIGIATDVWALGCILFCLCYKKHPFEDGAKLGIINGKYTIPNDSRFVCFNEIIKGCFVVDTTERFNVSMILERLGAISETMGWTLRGPLELKSKSPIHETQQPLLQEKSEEKQEKPPVPPPPSVDSRRTSNSTFFTNFTQTSQVPSQNNSQQPSSGAASGGLFSSIKGGAGSFLKNLKESSSKVMQTVQQTMSKTDLDVSFISQRVLVMPSPSEGLESAYKVNHIEDVKMFIEQRYHPSKVSVYNLGVKCPRLSPPVRTIECGFMYQPINSRAPILTHMYAIAEDMYGFLNADAKNVIILQSSDNAKSATMLCALMLYTQLIREPEDGMQMFAVKRSPPNMRASEIRYTYYMADVLRGHFPHYKPITLVSLNLSAIPRMTKARDGCRPYIEICVNDRVAVSTLQDYERMRVYHASEGKINFPLNITLCGDITITLLHARRSIVGQQQGLKICQMQFHSGYIPEEETLLLYNRNELDDVPDPEHVPSNFSINLSIFIGDDDRSPSVQPPWNSASHSKEKNPKALFSSQLEFEENVDNFITKPVIGKQIDKKGPPPRPAPPKSNIVENIELIESASSADEEPSILPSNEPPTTEFDFLRLHSVDEHKPPQINIPPPKVKEPSFDLLGGFDNNFQDPYPDLIGSALNKPTESNIHASKSAGDLEDIFGSASSNSVPTMAPNKSSNNLSFMNSNTEPPSTTTTSQKATFDPFADLTGSEFNSKPQPQQTPQANPFMGQQNLFNSSSTSSMPKSNSSTPIHQQKIPNEQQRPDYSRSHFQDPQQAQQKNKPADIFGDILGSQGYSFGSKNQGPRSINEMRKVELAQTMDPEKLKVQDWVEGKRGNIRALLCSVHTILWNDAKWTKCEMSSLMSANDVKKAYRRCCLAVHPDKHAGTDNENLAKLIFMELNNAFADFEGDATKQNLF